MHRSRPKHSAVFGVHFLDFYLECIMHAIDCVMYTLYLSDVHAPSPQKSTFNDCLNRLIKLELYTLAYDSATAAGSLAIVFRLRLMVDVYSTVCS